MTHAIHIDNLSKQFRDKRFRKVDAVAGISLTVNEGEAFGFIGPNGAGKTTTIKIMMGLARATAGVVQIFGEKSSCPAARKGVAYVPENLYLYDYLSPMEFLLAGARLHDVQAPDLKSHCLSWLERFGVAHVANKRIRSFSKGMTQRVALAHALAVKPRLLVLDEPLSGLDPMGRKQVVDVLQDYRSSGGTLFFSSHILHDVERLADRFGIIHKGLLRTTQTPAGLLGAGQQFIVRVDGQFPVDGADCELGSKWTVTTTQENLAGLLLQVNMTGQKLIAVEPAMNLESAFMQYISQE